MDADLIYWYFLVVLIEGGCYRKEHRNGRYDLSGIKESLKR